MSPQQTMISNGWDEENLRMEALLRRYNQRLKPEPENHDCEMSEAAIAYALNELTPEARQQVHQHILSCPYCYELALDVREANIEAKLAGQKKPNPQAQLLAAIGETKDRLTEVGGVAPRISGMLNAIKHYFSTFSDFSVVVGATTACAIVMIYFFFGDPTPVSVTMSVYVNSGGLSTRGSGEPEAEYLLTPGGEIQTGKYYRLVLVVEKPAFVYVFLAGETGRNEILYIGQTAAGQVQIPPDDPYGFKLDTQRGRETIFVLTATTEISGFTETIAGLKKADEALLQKTFPGVGVTAYFFNHS